MGCSAWAQDLYGRDFGLHCMWWGEYGRHHGPPRGREEAGGCSSLSRCLTNQTAQHLLQWDLLVSPQGTLPEIIHGYFTEGWTFTGPDYTRVRDIWSPHWQGFHCSSLPNRGRASRLLYSLGLIFKTSFTSGKRAFFIHLEWQKELAMQEDKKRWCQRNMNNSQRLKALELA